MRQIVTPFLEGDASKALCWMEHDIDISSIPDEDFIVPSNTYATELTYN